MMKFNRTNSKIVRGQVRKHIMEQIEDIYTIETLKEQIEALKGGNIQFDIQACKHFVEGGSLLISHYEVNEFLEGLNLFPCNYKDDTSNWELYMYLCTKELMEIIRGQF